MIGYQIDNETSPRGAGGQHGGVLQREIIRDGLKRLDLLGPDQSLPGVVKVRHGRNAEGELLHYYLNFSGEAQSISYPYGSGSDLLADSPVRQGRALILKPWDLAIVAER